MDYEIALLADKESSYDWERRGIPIAELIEESAQVPSHAAEDLQQILASKYALSGKDAWDVDETEFDAESHYEETSLSAGGFIRAWEDFERTVRTEARFFNGRAASHLESIFHQIDHLMTRSGTPFILKVGRGARLKRLYRARVFQADSALKDALARPDTELGPPPPQHASAGRMNPQGIAVFYGATSAKTALAEVRPPVGSKVAITMFEVIQPLRLLDLAALGEVVDEGSVFDPSWAKRLERVAFLRTLEERMTQAVMPNDEALDYVATQAICDFLAFTNTPPFDGIIYKSAQVARGRNVVLFHKAAAVEKVQLPTGTTVDASTSMTDEDGVQPWFSVMEEVPEVPVPVKAEDDDFTWFGHFAGDDPIDARHDTLRVMPDSIKVHIVKSSAYRSSRFSVHRHRVTKGKLPF